ncbi:hypothetical protein PIB30_016222 [Stylosanthes scabra]|uniref:Uncharacterized protein n=1 Tax=Stylosanthes scabra TaxID=79078 RepID=A0ABU6W6W1_9FABA|nr:hypothetical protein [Stylosanthes scabra]
MTFNNGKWHHLLRVREKCEDYNEKADVELGTIKIRHYHFEDESFVHPLHNVRFDPDRPYEIPIESLLADQPLSSSWDGKSFTRGSHPSRHSSPSPHDSQRELSSTQRVTSPSSIKEASSLCRRVASKKLRLPKSSKLVFPSKGWMCEGDEGEKEIGGMEPSVEKEVPSKKEEEEEEEKEDVEEDAPVIPLPMDVDSEGDSLRFLDDLIQYPSYSSAP